MVQASSAMVRDQAALRIRVEASRMMTQAVSRLTTISIRWFGHPAFSAAKTENHCSVSHRTGRLKGANAWVTGRANRSYHG